MKLLSKIPKISIFFFILLLLIILFLFNEWLAPSGAWSCHQSFDNNKLLKYVSSDCLGSPSPSERYAFSSEGSLLMLADPLYFSVFSPRPFQNIELEIIYRPYLTKSKPIFEIGFLADAKLWRYRLEPVYNLYLEKLVSDWELISDGDLKLYQKSNNFKSIAEFLNDQASNNPTDNLLLYNVNSDILQARLDSGSLKKQTTTTTFPYSLRGSHQFYVYLDNSKLELSGEFYDLNENKDLDDLEIILFDGSKQVANLKIIDDRAEQELSANQSLAKKFDFIQFNLNPALYKIEIRSSDDIVVQNLSVNSNYLSFINKIWPISTTEINLITDANYLQIKSLSPLSYQTLGFGEEKVAVSEIYKQYEVQNNNQDKKIALEHGGLILENSGVFSTEAENMLNPNYPQLDRFTFQNKNIEYILANYKSAELLDDAWQRSVVSFKASDLYRENGHYNLILSIPGLKLNEGAGGLMEIKDIKIKYYGPSLWQKLKSILFKYDYNEEKV